MSVYATHVSQKPRRGFKLQRYDGEQIYVRDGYTLKPCPGEAHSNPFIDNCAVCLKGVWGWAPSRLQPEDEP